MRIMVMDVPVDALTLQETLDEVRHSIEMRRPLQQVSLNVAKLVNMRTDATLREDVLSSEIISADGMGICFAAKILNHQKIERIAGVDLMLAVLELCSKCGFRPFFLGATLEVVRAAEEAAKIKFPGLQFAGRHDGYFNSLEELKVVELIRSSRPDCLFIAMPTPRKERFMKQYRGDLGVPFTMGVGGSLDILSGKTKRAPRQIQKIGMEWLFRVIQEPRRMFWRYFRTNFIFAMLLVVNFLKSFLRDVA